MKIPRRARPASTPLSSITIVVTAGLAVAAVVALIYLAVIAPRGVPAIQYRYVNAQFANVSNVTVSTEVRIAGRTVGQVVSNRVRDGRAELRLQLRPSAVPLKADATAHIGLKGLLGGKFVELDPGTETRELADGAVIPASRTSTSVDLLDVAQTFDDPARDDVRATLTGLGQGFADRSQDINDLIKDLAPMARSMTAVSRAILAREGAAERLFPALDSTASAFAAVEPELIAGLRPGANVLEAFADERAAIQRTLEEAPPALSSLRVGLDAATPLLGEVQRLARVTTQFTGPAPEALQRTAQLLRDARPALRETGPLLTTLDDAVPPTLTLLRRLDPISGPARRALTLSLPPLVELGRRPCDLSSFAVNWRSMMGFGVPPGLGDPAGDLDDDAGLGAINSVRLMLASPPAPDTTSFDVNPIAPVGNAYPDACQAEMERTR